MSLASCSDEAPNPPDSAEPGRDTASGDTDTPIAPGIRYVTLEANIEAKCASDAQVLGWAVPCPSVLPGVSDPGWCDGSCVYTGGEPPIPMFYMSVDDFPGPAPDGPDTVRHLVLVAFPRGAEAVLDPPCPDAEPLPSLPTTLGELEMFRCGDGRQDDGRVLHGEGTNRGHDLVRWYRDGIAYAVSLHQSGLDEREVLRRVAEGIEYIS